MEPEPPGAVFFCQEPEPKKFGRSRSRRWDLKVAAPQHWVKLNIVHNTIDIFLIPKVSFAEPEPIFWSVGAESRMIQKRGFLIIRSPVLRSQSRLFKAAPATSFRKAYQKRLVVVLSMDSVKFIKITMIETEYYKISFSELKITNFDYRDHIFVILCNFSLF